MFKLKSILGRSHNVDLVDTLMAKKTFGGLGYYKTPSYGMTKYPDEPLFKGIESFQKDNGLRKDGVMHPDGETETVLNHMLKRAELINGLKSGKEADNSNMSSVSTSRFDPQWIFDFFDRFNRPDFHFTNGGASTRCCATGTCDNIE